MAESEWGKLNAGQTYGLLAIDVDRALVRAHMTDSEWAVFQYVRERTWGTATLNKRGSRTWPDPTPLRWHLRDVAAEMGLPKNRVCEAKASLVQSHMIHETAAGLLPSKDADHWTFPPGHPRAGQRRLDAAALAYAMAGRTRRDEAPAAPAGPDPSADSVPPIRNGRSADPERINARRSANPERNSADPERSFRESGTVVPPIRNAPLEERAREEDTERKRKETPLPGGPGGGVGRPLPESAPTPEAFAALSRKADKIGFGDELRRAWHKDGRLRLMWEDAPGHPGWSEALADFARSPEKGLGYYLGIVRRLVRERPKARPEPEIEYYRAPPDDPRKPVIIPVNSRLNRRA